jgi:hypothetical protein
MSLSGFLHAPLVFRMESGRVPIFNGESHDFTGLFVSCHVTRHLSRDSLIRSFTLSLPLLPPLRPPTLRRISTRRIPARPLQATDSRSPHAPRRRSDDHVSRRTPLRRNVSRRHYAGRLLQASARAAMHNLRRAPQSVSARSQDNSPTADHPLPSLAKTRPTNLQRIRRGVQQTHEAPPSTPSSQNTKSPSVTSSLSLRTRIGVCAPSKESHTAPTSLSS